MSLVSVVRFGPDENNPSAKALRSALVTHFENQQDTAEEQLELGDNQTLKISNKYFRANVVLQELDSKEAPKSSKEDGVILVFDSLHSNPDRPVGDRLATFDSLHQVHKIAEEKDTCGDLLRLCVGVRHGDLSVAELRGKNHEQEFARRIHWCLDHGYEYVEADLSEDGLQKGHDERDKDGFARIVEAIQGTIWSSAVMSKSRQQDLQKSFDRDAAQVQQQSDGEAKEDPQNQYEPPDPSKFSNVTIANAKPDDIAGLLLEPELATSSDRQELKEDMETEQFFDNMEGALKEAARIRQASKQGTLTDEERRQRAGEAALTLMKLMDQMGLDDDSEAGEDSSVEETST